MKKIIGWRGLLVVACVVVAGCDDPADVVLYVSADEHYARQVVAAFEEHTGLTVKCAYDTEAKKTTGLVERLRSEHDNPQADVFWSSEIFQTIALADEGVLAPYTADALIDWPAPHRDAERRWYAMAARARVIVYAPDRVAEADVPESWMDFNKEPLRGRVVMADPRFGTTGGHLGAMKVYWQRNAPAGYYEAVLDGRRAYGVRILPSGNAGVVRAIIAGEADLGMTDTDDVWAARANGHDLEFVYPRHGLAGSTGSGTLLIPNTVALVAGAPNPDAAGRLIEFLLSEPVERLLAESTSHNIPLRPGLAADYPELNVPAPMRVDFAAAAAARPTAVAEAMKTLSEPADRPAPPESRDHDGAADDA